MQFFFRYSGHDEIMAPLGSFMCFWAFEGISSFWIICYQVSYGGPIQKFLQGSGRLNCAPISCQLSWQSSQSIGGKSPCFFIINLMWCFTLQISQDIYPVGTYSNLSLLVLVFLLTDWARYKPVIVLEGISGALTYCLIIWGHDVPTIQVMPFPSQSMFFVPWIIWSLTHALCLLNSTLGCWIFLWTLYGYRSSLPYLHVCHVWEKRLSESLWVCALRYSIWAFYVRCCQSIDC